ncbi:efflux RND transporter periplasmic adaptor subunit [Acetatifactor muris]|uniref:efflux RND transporter periplasmic adaptor subunit n=1 Tax=Acetatifactor muris TaxID=879566 RepID=UPI0023F38CAA|nr:hypothetical protein [Acetatifactor muris]MCI8799303.1 hypothetical protein [Lachnospiraceae bacterium]
MSKIRIMAAVSLLAAVILAGCGDSGQEQTWYSEELPAPEQANYEIIQVQEGEYLRTTGGSLHVYYPITAELCWEEDSIARFREILVKKGEEVREGDAIATFDIEVSRADREEMTLSLARETEALRLGREDRLSAIEEAREDAEGLRDHELRIAQLKIEKMETEYEQFVYQSEREIARLQKSLEELEEKAGNDTLFAPFDGVIDSVTFYNPGDLMTADNILVTMHATDRFYLAADNGADALRYNMDVVVEAGKKNERKTYVGKVVAVPAVLPASVPGTVALIELYEEISQEDLKTSLQYQYNSEELQGVLLLDRSAVDSEEGKSYVYVLEEDMVQKRYIVPGLTNMKEIWILDGLTEGQTVIAD